MYDGRFDLVEVLERRDDLHDDTPRLSLRYRLVLLQVEVQVVAVAVLQHRAERVGVYLEHVVKLDDSRVVQRFVDIVLP